MRNSFLLLASLATASQAGVPNVFRPNDPARSAAVNANFRYLDSAVGTKADTSALNTVRASIPAGVNIGGKVDTAALTARLAGYVPTSTLADYAKTTALSSYATTAVVNGKMNTADYVASGHLKALGGLTGGRGISGSFMGTSHVLD
ncbi:MAG TPA: hypothetical protein PKY05_08285, partial [Fibrobacteria bacterium]|nr:hypothetical protein [Fibrobacteria bacterium]